MTDLQRVWVVFSDRYEDGRWELTRQPFIYATKESAKSHALEFARALSGVIPLGTVRETDGDGEVKLRNGLGTVGWHSVEVKP